MAPVRTDPDLTSRGAPEGPSREPSVWSSVVAQAHGEGLGSLAEAVDRILCTGVSVDGAATISVAGVELVLLDLRLMLAAIDTVRPQGSFFSASPASCAPPRSPAPPAPRDESTDPAHFSAPPSAAPRASASDRSVETVRASPPSAAAAAHDDPHDHGGMHQGLVKLVLTLVNLLHEVLERQAVRRMGNGTLTPAEIESVGTALYAQTMEIARLRQLFGLSEADLTLRLSAPG
jgi:hypothetical protein